MREAGGAASQSTPIHSPIPDSQMTVTGSQPCVLGMDISTPTKDSAIIIDESSTEPMDGKGKNLYCSYHVYHDDNNLLVFIFVTQITKCFYAFHHAICV